MLVWMTNWTLCGAATRCVNKQCWKALIWKVPQQCHCYNRGWSQSCKAVLAALWARGSHLQTETSEGWQKWFDYTGEWKSAHNVFLEYNGAGASMLICQRHRPLLLAISGCRVKHLSSLFFLPVRNKMPSFIADWSWIISSLFSSDRKMKFTCIVYLLCGLLLFQKKKILKNRQLLTVCGSSKRYLFYLWHGFTTTPLYSQCLATYIKQIF